MKVLWERDTKERYSQDLNVRGENMLKEKENVSSLSSVQEKEHYLLLSWYHLPSLTPGSVSTKSQEEEEVSVQLQYADTHIVHPPHHMVTKSTSAPAVEGETEATEATESTESTDPA